MILLQVEYVWKLRSCFSMLLYRDELQFAESKASAKFNSKTVGGLFTPTNF